MCNIDRRAEAQILTIGLDLIKTAMEAGLREKVPSQSTDVLAVATSAYQQGKITKNQLIAVINALDEDALANPLGQKYQTTAYAEPSWNKEYLEANKYLNQYRGN
jgi:hypothetical protein